jgi:hypothetical protein
MYWYTFHKKTMSKAATSVFAFGVYLGGLSLILLLIPNFLLSVFGMMETEEVWIRVVGMLVLFLAVYYTQMAREENATFFWLTVYLRSAVILFFVLFVLLKMASPMLILFGAVDLAGGLWTWSALHKKP